MSEKPRRLFHVGEEAGHHVGDPQCPLCLEEYPARCRCGGLMHATGGTQEDEGGALLLITRCDGCGRSEDEVEGP
jgi:hypothetical protein